jgi:hypothetical protein
VSEQLTERYCGHYLPPTVTLCPTCGSGRWQWITIHNPDESDQENKETN